MSLPLRHHLIVGGQRSGKSRHAERLGRAWLAGAEGRSVAVVATALASDEEMRQRIERHRRERPEGFVTLEAPVHLGQALRCAAAPGRLLIVDCLTLWLAQCLAPHVTADAVRSDWIELKADLLAALAGLDGPVLLISNEIGMGVIPMGPEVRRFVDELGWLHQDVVRHCALITLMVAGQPFTRDVEAKWD